MQVLLPDMDVVACLQILWICSKSVKLPGDTGSLRHHATPMLMTHISRSPF